jgi:hypothetical protein
LVRNKEAFVVDGKWKETKGYKWVIDPMNGDKFLEMPNTDVMFPYEI